MQGVPAGRISQGMSVQNSDVSSDEGSGSDESDTLADATLDAGRPASALLQSEDITSSTALAPALSITSRGGRKLTVKQAMRLSLHQPELLRGTTTATLLERCGARLQGSVSGGLGTRADGDADYMKSFPAEELDIFFSHSWRASWQLKYLILLFHFNRMPTIVVGVLAAVASVVLRWNADTKLLAVYERTMYTTQLSSPESLLPPLQTLKCWHVIRDYHQAMPLGLTAMLLVLLSWHHVIARVGCLRQLVFFDKLASEASQGLHTSDGCREEAGRHQ
eukprot:4144270-Amphidinium_carterae.1